MVRRVRRFMTEREMAAILADPSNLERWRERTKRYVDAGSCWIWGTHEQRIGLFKVRVGSASRTILAPRMSLLLKLGRPLRSGFFACHACDRPGCVNPDCLWEGTPAENAQDAGRKGRFHHVDVQMQRKQRIQQKRSAIKFYRRRLEAAEQCLVELVAEDRLLSREESARPQVRPMQFGRAAQQESFV